LLASGTVSLVCVYYIYLITAFSLSLPGDLEKRKIVNYTENLPKAQSFHKIYISLWLTTAKLSEKLISRTIQKETDKINLLNTSQFVF
jgi:hypothetical protein